MVNSDLNYKHLRYFWTVARVGTIAEAGRVLGLAPHSISAQLATFEGALVRLREHLKSLGVDGEGLRLTNGSGLYDANRITAAQLTKLLVAAYNDFRISADYLASLPILGADGTLRSRGKESAAQRYVRAKTGTLNEASALSGYAGAIGKPPLAFSILIGDIKRSQTRAARDAQNRIAELLAEVAAAETAAAKG